MNQISDQTKLEVLRLATQICETRIRNSGTVMEAAKVAADVEVIFRKMLSLIGK
jgi:hypothetical protein